MALVHFKGPYAMKTACGRSRKQASATTERADQVTCPQCKEALARRRDADRDLGNYTILDDMVGIAKIRRSESKGQPKKRLIETLEMQIAVPDVSHGIAVENMLAQWGGVQYAELSVLLVKLRHLAMVHQTHHWAAKGDPFYGDHLLYERLYETIIGEIDALAEKSVGLGSEDNVNLPLQAMQLAQLTKEYGTAVTLPVASSLPQRSMAAEVDFLRCAALCACSLKEKGLMTRGLDNFLQGLEDKHESHVYLLKRRCNAPGNLVSREGLREYVEMPLADLEQKIKAMGADDVAEDDYVDSDSGEIYLEKGLKARTSQLHPEYVRDMQVRMAADREARRLEDEQWAKEDAEWEAEQDRAKQEAQTAFDAAVREYAGNWTDWRQSMGDEDTEEQSVAMDAAEGFFHQFPEWKRWAAELGMKKSDIQSMVADFVYEAIITGRVDF